MTLLVAVMLVFVCCLRNIVIETNESVEQGSPTPILSPFIGRRPLEIIDTSGDNWNKTFRVIWNMPTEGCLSTHRIDLNLSAWGIEANTRNKFLGEVISLLYADSVGQFPYIKNDDGNLTLINGGVPQNGNLTRHLAKVSVDLDKHVPKKNFSGLGILDFESWRPAWDNTYEVYNDFSRRLVAEKHPSWTKKQIEEEASKQFTSAARMFFDATLRLVNRLRPRGLWGYYGFPRCYDPKSSSCSDTNIQGTDGLLWLYNISGALYPSIYPRGPSTTPERNREHILGTIRRSLRIKHLLAGEQDTLIYPYTVLENAGHFYTMNELNASIGQSYYLGLSGVIIWGSSSNTKSKEDCTAIQTYVANVLGPYLQTLTGSTIGGTTATIISPGSTHGTATTIPSPVTNGCNSMPCMNGGTCAYSRSDVYSCTCLKGLTGKYCETEVNECSSSPCEHDGTCIDIISGYTCSCAKDYTGSTCEISIIGNLDQTSGCSLKSNLWDCNNVTLVHISILITVIVYVLKIFFV